VDASLRFGRRHALHAMRARFGFQSSEDLWSDDAANHLANRRHLRPGSHSKFSTCRPAPFGVAHVHPQQNTPAKIAASSPPVPARISRNTLRRRAGRRVPSMQAWFEFFRCDHCVETLAFLIAERTHLRIGIGGECVGARQFLLESDEGRITLGERR
jgi:hypothetical protein